MRHNRFVKCIGLLLVVVLSATGCGQPAVTQTTPVEELPPEPGVLTPEQVDSSRLHQVVKVRGTLKQVVQNPGGLGGIYATISGGGGEVDLRIDRNTWDALNSAQKTQYEQGKAVTVEGMLVLAGTKLVVVLGRTIPPTSVGDTTFIVKVPENTVVSYAVYMQLVDEQSQNLSAVKMEQVDVVTWQVSIPSVPEKFGYRYTRDGIGFPTGEEFTPDSPDTYRWSSPMPGEVINDVVTKWRWCPEPGHTMPVVETLAETAAIAQRVNDEEFQCGYGFVDFWWTPFHDIVYGTSLAMQKGNGNRLKIAPPVGFSQIEPLPKMNWEIVPDNPIYPEGELEYHIAQAQKAGLNVFLSPQCGVLNSPLSFDGDKQYSTEWWEALYQEMERYSTYFADLAEECGVKYMVFQDFEVWNSSNAPADIAQKYDEYIANIRQHYSGKLGMTWALGGSYESPADMFPTGYHPERFDFFAVGGPQKITSSKEPAVAEMKANFKKILEEAVEPLYQQYQKPVILYSAGYPSLDGGASRDFTHDDPAMDVFESYSDKYQLDLVEQAQAFEALMQVVAETPYITGFYPFNSHWPTSLPLSEYALCCLGETCRTDSGWMVSAIILIR
ncbi:MAG: hypothetical protein PHN78_05200 [Dehalococcoidales bacterium]|nr:hypothetical protein [Dehalococcoidales bacterium]